MISVHVCYGVKIFECKVIIVYLLYGRVKVLGHSFMYIILSSCLFDLNFYIV